MPWVELLRPLSMAPPTVGSTCVCPSLFGLSVGPSHPLGKPEGEPFGMVPLKNLLVPHRSCHCDVP
jgi:hypothetical protein